MRCASFPLGIPFERTRAPQGELPARREGLQDCCALAPCRIQDMTLRYASFLHSPRSITRYPRHGDRSDRRYPGYVDVVLHRDGDAMQRQYRAAMTKRSELRGIGEQIRVDADKRLERQVEAVSFSQRVLGDRDAGDRAVRLRLKHFGNRHRRIWRGRASNARNRRYRIQHGECGKGGGADVAREGQPSRVGVHLSIG